jgi:hypothetical protein
MLYSKLIQVIAFITLSVAPWSAHAVESTPEEQAVIVHFNYGSTDLKPLRRLEDQLTTALDASGIGDFDGDEIAVSGKDGFLYMYGANADAVLALVGPILHTAPFMSGAKVTRVYGKLGTDVRRVETIIAP